MELTVTGADETAALAVAERLAGELLSNPLIETFGVERLMATSSATSADESAMAVPQGTGE